MPISAAAAVLRFELFGFDLGVMGLFFRGASRPGGASVYYNRLGDDLALLLAKPRRGDFAVMAEKSQPSVAGDLRQPFFLVGERRKRIRIQAHDPRQG